VGNFIAFLLGMITALLTGTAGEEQRLPLWLPVIA
jgi:hypothetical protein